MKDAGAHQMKAKVVVMVVIMVLVTLLLPREPEQVGSRSAIGRKKQKGRHEHAMTASKSNEVWQTMQLDKNRQQERQSSQSINQQVALPTLWAHALPKWIRRRRKDSAQVEKREESVRYGFAEFHWKVLLLPPLWVVPDALTCKYPIDRDESW